MDSQMEHPSSQSHIHENDPHNAGIHAGDDHPEAKQSVMTKVKARAKKMKDTLKKHGYGHNQDQDHDDPHDGHVPDDHDLEEKNDEYEEMVKDPEVQGAPIYDSAAIKTGALGGGISDTAAGSATAMPHGHGHEQPLASRDVSGVKSSDPTRISVPGVEENIAQPKSNFGKPSPMGEEESHAPLNTPISSDSTDPSRTAGAEEIGATPILRSFNKMSIDDESEAKPPTGSHDQFSQNPNAMEENLDTTDRNDRDTTGINPTNATSYREKLRSATPVIVDKAIAAKNVVASKLGYGEKDDSTDHRIHDNEAHGTGDGSTVKPSSTVEYGRKISARVTEKLTPVYKKAAEAGSTVMSKMSASGTTGAGSEAEKSKVKGKDKGVSVKDFIAEKLRPGDEDRALSQVISDSLHKRKQEPEESESGPPMGEVTQSEEATRRLGTGDEKSERQERDEPAAGYVNHPETGGSGDEKGVVDKRKQEPEKSESGPPMGEVTQSEEATRRLGTGDEKSVRQERDEPAAGYVNHPETGGDGDEKGVVDKRKQEPERSESGPPMGEVTQSEEVTRRLGIGDEKSERQERDEPAAGYVNNPETGGGGDGKGVVGKVKGAVGSWFGLGGGDQSSQTSHVGDGRGDSAASVGEDSISKDEPRLPESGN